MQSGLSDPRSSSRTYKDIAKEVAGRSANVTTARQMLSFFAGGSGRAAASLTAGVFVYGANTVYEKAKSQLQAF